MDSNSCGDVAEDGAKTAQCNSADRCQRQKQGGAVGAAASRMRVPPKARCSRWEPRPGLLIQRGSRHPPAHVLHLSLTCDTIQVSKTIQTEDFSMIYDTLNNLPNYLGVSDNLDRLFRVS